MAETMLQIFQRHRDCFDFTKDPDWQASAEARQMYHERQQEREQAANEYVNNVLAANDNWAEDINEDVSKLALSFQRILIKAEREAYKDATEQFLLYIAQALREHRVKQLSPVTRYRMGREEKAMNIVTGLTRDEAASECRKMKERGFTHVCAFPTEAFPAVFTAFGYKPKGNGQASAKTHTSDTNSEGMGSNTTSSGETPPAAQEQTKTAILQPYAPNPVGRRSGKFADVIADRYTDKERAAIESHIKSALESMSDPKAVIALFVVYFDNKILKQCPTYWQALRLLDIEAEGNTDKEKLCPFGKHQQYDRLRNTYFDKDKGYLSLNETDNIQDSEIRRFMMDARQQLGLLNEELAALKNKRKGKKKTAGTA